MNLSAVPVIYYHSIKPEINNDWIHPYITMPLELFQRHLKLLKSLRMKTFFMDEIYDHLNGRSKLPFNSLSIHLDDGYLDNYVFAYPLLKKYNLKATIWVNPEFIDNESNYLRPTLEDYWNGKTTIHELSKLDGFLNWEEMRLMERSGLVEIQSHTMSHTKYPVSDKIVDFYSPNTKIDWLYWNLFPQEKINFLNSNKNQIPLGYPIYETKPANVAVKYEESGKLTDEIIKYVKNNGSADFFNKKDWKEVLFSLSYELKKQIPDLYSKESDATFIARVKQELIESKKIIEINLDKKVNHLCWPFGVYNKKALELASECGYDTSSIKGKKNLFGTKENVVGRIAIDNPKYQNFLFAPYSIYKLFGIKI